MKPAWFELCWGNELVGVYGTCAFAGYSQRLYGARIGRRIFGLVVTVRAAGEADWVTFRG